MVYSYKDTQSLNVSVHRGCIEGGREEMFLILERNSLKEKVWLLSTGTHLPDSCHPVFPVKTLQYCSSQRVLLHHLNDIRRLFVSEHDSKGQTCANPSVPPRKYSELILLGT